MPAVQRQGDTNSAGGVILTGIGSVTVNGRPIAAGNLKVSPHPCCGRKKCPPSHCSAITRPGSSGVRIAGQQVVLTGHKDSCGHARIGGSQNVFVGG